MIHIFRIKTKKRIINALKKVRADFIQLPELNRSGICCRVAKYIEESDRQFFIHWFTPDKFGITRLYGKGFIQGIPIEQVDKDSYKMYYWFNTRVMGDDIHITNGKRLRIIDKAIDLLEQETKFTYQVRLLLKTIRIWKKNF